MGTFYWASCLTCVNSRGNRVRVGFVDRRTRDTWVLDHTCGTHIVETWSEERTFPVTFSLN